MKKAYYKDTFNKYRFLKDLINIFMTFLINIRSEGMARRKKTTETRRVKAGTIQMMDPQSGELKNVQHYEIKDVDIHWNKVWLGHIPDVLDMVGNRKMQVLSWSIEQRDVKTDEVIAIQQEIINSTWLSKKNHTRYFQSIKSIQCYN